MGGGGVNDIGGIGENPDTGSELGSFIPVCIVCEDAGG